MNELMNVLQIPKIEEHLQDVSAMIDDKIKFALSLVCDESTVKEIKATRSELTKNFEVLEEQRKAVKKAVLKPYEDFEKVYKACVSDKFKNADKQLKDRITDVENDLRTKREVDLIEYFDAYKKEKNCEWLDYAKAGIKINLSDSDKKLKDKVKDYIDSVCVDLEVIAATKTHTDELLNAYKITLNLSKAFIKVEEAHKIVAKPGDVEETAVKPKAKTLDDILDDINVESVKATYMVTVSSEYITEFNDFCRRINAEIKEV